MNNEIRLNYKLTSTLLGFLRAVPGTPSYFEIEKEFVSIPTLTALINLVQESFGFYTQRRGSARLVIDSRG